MEENAATKEILFQKPLDRSIASTCQLGCAVLYPTQLYPTTKSKLLLNDTFQETFQEHNTHIPHWMNFETVKDQVYLMPSRNPWLFMFCEAVSSGQWRELGTTLFFYGYRKTGLAIHGTTPPRPGTRAAAGQVLLLRGCFWGLREPFREKLSIQLWRSSLSW